MAFAKFQENRFIIDGLIAENHAILVNLTASIVTSRPIGSRLLVTRLNRVVEGIFAQGVFSGPSFVFCLRPKKNICLFPICCHFNQWVCRKFFIFFFYFLSLQPIGRIIFYFIWRQIHFHACLICTLRNNFFFWTLFDPPSPFRNVFSVTLTTASNLYLNLRIS